MRTSKLHEEKLQRIEEARKIIADANFLDKYDYLNTAKGIYLLMIKMGISCATARSYLNIIRGHCPNP